MCKIPRFFLFLNADNSRKSEHFTRVLFVVSNLIKRLRILKSSNRDCIIGSGNNLFLPLSLDHGSVSFKMFPLSFLFDTKSIF